MLLCAPCSPHGIAKAVMLCCFLLFGHVFGTKLKQNMEFCRPEREKGLGMSSPGNGCPATTAVVCLCVREWRAGSTVHSKVLTKDLLPSSCSCQLTSSQRHLVPAGAWITPQPGHPSAFHPLQPASWSEANIPIMLPAPFPSSDGSHEV